MRFWKNIPPVVRYWIEDILGFIGVTILICSLFIVVYAITG